MAIPIMPPPTVPPSGMLSNILSTMMSGVAFLNILTPGTCDTILFIPNGTFVRIFEGFNATYLFNTPDGVISSIDNSTWRSVANFASSITQVDANEITVLFQNNASTITSKVYSQAVPESYSNWKLETTMSGIVVSDSVGDPDAILSVNLPILVGNNRFNTFPRIFRNAAVDRPAGTFIKSDTGIPQVTPTIAQITDLEAI